MQARRSIEWEEGGNGVFAANEFIGVLLVVILGIFIYFRYANIKGMRNLNAEQFTREMEDNADKLLIDVREIHEFRNGHIRGATNIPLSQLTHRMKEIPREKKLLIYCQSGMRSRQAGRMLAKQGYANLVNLRGGIISWRGPKVK